MTVSPQAQAVILLTVHFGKTASKPLSVREWARFAVWLKDHECEPSRLLRGDPGSLLSGWTDRAITVERIEGLLDRGGALGLALEKWQRAGLWIITRSETDYPERLKRKLRFDSPPVLFGCGNKAFLGKGGIAIVGSRDADEDDLGFSTSLARTAASQGLSVVSGAARGVDESAMLGALEDEGTVVGVMADSLLRAAISAKYRKHLLSGDLVLVSPFNPEAGFNVGNAMARNKYIYCLSDAAVVVSSTPGKGGTWSGAIEDLKKEWVPLWVKPKGNPESGNAALVRKGARWLPEDMSALSDLWEASSAGDPTSEPSGLPLLPPWAESVSVAGSAPSEAPSADREDDLASGPDADDKPSEPVPDFYGLFLRRLLELTGDDALKPAEISERLELAKSQVDSWLKRGVAGGQIRKFNKPVRYQSASAEHMPTLSGLWEANSAEDPTSESSGLSFPPPRAESVPIAGSAPSAASSAGGEDSLASGPDTDDKSLELVTDFYVLFLRRLLELTGDDALKAAEISERLELRKSQMDSWLKRGVADGLIRKSNKPVRYQSASAEQRQASFLGDES